MKYADDPAWADVPKISQNEDANAVCPIAYSEQFCDVMDCFRGVLQTNELSPRALELTEHVVQANPANYTAWYFRRKVIDALQHSLYKELEFTEKMAITNPKNYQIWHHRREICTRLDDGTFEKDFCARALICDKKNYHAWAHRQWAVHKFQLWEGELEFVQKLLLDDVRNNSAWNHRYYTVLHNPVRSLSLYDHDIRNREVNVAFAHLEKSFYNESVWNYLRGIHHSAKKHSDVQGLLALEKTLKEKCMDVMKCCSRNIYASALLIDLLEKEKTQVAFDEAEKLLSELSDEWDKVRRPYWIFRSDMLRENRRKSMCMDGS